MIRFFCWQMDYPRWNPIPDNAKQPLYQLFAEAVSQLCMILSEKIISDGKHITKVIEINIKGASSDADAEKRARAIANTLLVKTSWYGNDPNWGRMVHAVGYAGLGLSEKRLDLFYHALFASCFSSGNSNGK